MGGVLLRKELKRIGIQPIGEAILILGFFFILIGFFILPRSLTLSLGLIAYGIFLTIPGVIIARSNLISREHVTGDWAHLIEGAQGKAEEIFKRTEDFLKQSGVSTIQMERKELIPGIIRGVLGKKRDFLVVKDKNFRLRPYQLLVDARDYGNNLDVSWYLTYRLPLIRALLSTIPFISFVPRKVEDLDVFDLQDLRAYNTVCHHSVLSAVEKLMLSLSQDPSKIERKSRGFLGIS